MVAILRKLAVVVITFNFSLLNAQNLVPNPSFEDKLSCPTEVGEFNTVDKWLNFRGSPDYFNRCADTFVSIPCNRFGCQEPATGEGYTGLYGLNKTDSYREVIGVQLTEALVIGQTYYVSFKASPAYGGYFGIRWFCNKLGVKFSMTTYSVNNPVPIDNSSHILSNAIISDTSVWTSIQGAFTADKAYPYIMLGNFFDNLNTDTLADDSNTLGAYYYIDDVCVTTNPAGCTFTSSVIDAEMDKFLLYPNPASNRLYIHHLHSLKPSAILYDVTGKSIPVELYSNQTQSEIDISRIASGVYYLKLTDRSVFSTKKIIIKH